MSEGIIHKNLKDLALKWLKTKVIDIVCPEVDFYNIKCVADVVGINYKRKEVRIIEIKSSKKDLIRDKKLFNEETSYFYHSHYVYIMCPKEVIKIEDIPKGYGLIWVDENEKIKVIKKPIKNKSRLKTMFETTLRISTKKLTNIFLFQEENKYNKDETGGFFSSKSKIKLISFKCPLCKKIKKELINKDNISLISCSCGNKINLKNISFKEITGFNNSFIKKINNLI